MTDIDYLRTWIGREEQAEEVISANLVERYRATVFDDEDAHAHHAPLAIHWCLAPPVAPLSEIGADGHPRRGGFLPPAPLQRRMWAGGRVETEDSLLIGERVIRRSRIEDVVAKQGRAGELIFVAVGHVYETRRGVALRERQDIVYSNPPPVGTPPAPAPQATADIWSDWDQAGEARLFRYSAITFNGHRIHYDRGYAAAEGYAGIVAHGPLQASLLLHFARRLHGEKPRIFSFRGLRPLLCPQRFRLGATTREGGFDLWVVAEDGVASMAAQARW